MNLDDFKMKDKFLSALCVLELKGAAELQDDLFYIFILGLNSNSWWTDKMEDCNER